MKPKENREEILKTRGRRKAETLLSMLRQDIQKGVFKDGDKIPSYDQLGESYGINRLTVRKTLKILEEEGLVHSLPAKGTYAGKGPLQTKPSYNRIGLISSLFSPDTIGQHHFAVVEHLSATLLEQEYFLQFCMTCENEPSDTWWKSINDGEYSGLIAMGPVPFTALEKLALQYPLIHIDPQVASPLVASVCIDNFSGGKIAAETLISQGHRHIAVILGDQPCSEERLAGFQMVAHKTKGLKLKTYEGNFSIPSGQRCAHQICEDFPGASAVFCINDEMAAGAMQVFTARGILIPQDISVLGFDDSPIAQVVAPPLSSVGISTKHIAKASCDALLHQIQHQKQDFIPNTSISPKLVTRSSVGRPKFSA